jgi:hypothetical protein
MWHRPVGSIVPAADEVCAGGEGGPQAVTVATLVVGQEVLVQGAVEAQQTVARPCTARPHTHDDEQTC